MSDAVHASHEPDASLRHHDAHDLHSDSGSSADWAERVAPSGLPLPPSPSLLRAYLPAGNAAVARLVDGGLIRRAPDAPAAAPASGGGGSTPQPGDDKHFDSAFDKALGLVGKKKSKKTSVNLPHDKSFFNGWAKSEGTTFAGEVSVEVAKSGATTIISAGQGTSSARSNEMQDYGKRKTQLEGEGQTVGLEAKTAFEAVAGTTPDWLGSKATSRSSELKWAGLEALVSKDANGKEKLSEASIGVEWTGKYEITLADGWKATPQVSAAVTLMAASYGETVPKVKIAVGTVSAHMEGAYKKQIATRDIAGLRLPAYEQTYAAKLSGSYGIRLNEEKVAKEIAIKVAEKVAVKALPQLVRGLRVLDSPPAKMITIGVLTVANAIDAYIEGDRQKNLGELAATLPYVFAGGFLSTYKKMPVSAPATSNGPVAQFQTAGAAAGTKARGEIVAEVKKLPEASGHSDEEIGKEVDAAVKDKPMGLPTIAGIARTEVDAYVLKKFIEGRENSATKVFDLFGGTDHKIDPNNPEGSAEYVHFRDKILKAYTTRQNDPYYSDTAFKNAVQAAEKAGVPPDQMEAWIAQHMQKQAQGSIDAAEPETRGDDVEKAKQEVRSLLSGWVSDDDIRQAGRVLSNVPKEKREEVKAVMIEMRNSLVSDSQAALLDEQMRI
jgi:hypothetical protein